LKVVLSRRANLDLMAQLDWLAELSPSAALEAAEIIKGGLRTLGQFPLAGRAVSVDERKWPIAFGRDGFTAIYRIERDRVVIARIFHSRQDR
jgi:plasmid stabilization system protein ParE